MLLLVHGEVKKLVMTVLLIQRLGENVCRRCKQRIETAEELSI